MRRWPRPLPAIVLSTLLALLARPASPFQTAAAAQRQVDDNVASVARPEVDPLVVSPEMHAFIDAKVGRNQTRQARLYDLQHAIFDPEEGLGVTYGSAATYSAAGTFDQRSGNCLSFTLLFVALARHLDLDAYFVEVDEVTGWSQRGDVGLSHWHMYAEVEHDNAVTQVDFLPWIERRYLSARRISDSRARAHYHSNVGADLVSAGRATEALDHFERALELDPTFEPARINRAVAHHRSGQTQLGVAALLGVLEREPGNTIAATNLASLYLADGRQDEAERWLARREAALGRNPYYHFRLGMRALKDGDPAAARDHFKRAVSRQATEPVFFEKLAESQFRLGRIRKARSGLKRAIRLTEDEERRQLLEARLETYTRGPVGS